MGISLNQIIQEKEVFSKKINNIIIFLCLIFFTYKASFANTSRDNVLKQINDIQEFSSRFIEVNNNSISEGNIYIKNKRIRIDYIKPSKITIILSENKAMYFNKDLEEVEYFNPKNTIANIFYKIFLKKDFFNSYKLTRKENVLILENNLLIDEVASNIKIIFETRPFLIKKIQLSQKNNLIMINIINPNYYPLIDDKFFSMANPLLK